MQSNDVRAVILAGGSGTRLWPLSRLQAPKQFLEVAGNRTMLEATIDRLHPLVDASEVVIVANEDIAKGKGFEVLSRYHTILEPEGRNTAPAIGIAATWFRRNGIDPVMLVLPSDHLILNLPAFHEALSAAILAAREGKLVTFGIEPRHPATGYGYIKVDRGKGPPHPVERFTEKPDRAMAELMLAQGGYFWNSGMFAWKASSILAAIDRNLPELSKGLAAMEALAREGDFATAVHAMLPTFPSISIDYGVLEKSDNIFLIPGTFGWSDLGNWDSVYEVSEKDANGNAVLGDVIAIDCSRSLVRSQNRLVAAVGLEDVAIVETADAVLVTKRGGTESVRRIVDELTRRASTQHVNHSTVHRPWGTYTVLGEHPGYKIKSIEVRAGGRLSMQRHRFRSEHWVVVQGVATVTCDGKVHTCSVNESTFIPIGAKHRLENRGETPLSIIEVQVGSYVGEDDIQRFDDHYGRATEKDTESN
jgi:mannose-1-phosphate guanylyltransferase/mannose-6-phosphate isomerase